AMTDGPKLPHGGRPLAVRGPPFGFGHGEPAAMVEGAAAAPAGQVPAVKQSDKSRWWTVGGKQARHDTQGKRRNHRGDKMPSRNRTHVRGCIHKRMPQW